MCPVALRVSRNERGELALVTGHELIAKPFRLVLLRNFIDMRLQLAGQRGSDGGNILFRQQGCDVSVVTLQRVASHALGCP
jgi:hypothetical protein